MKWREKVKVLQTQVYQYIGLDRQVFPCVLTDPSLINNFSGGEMMMKSSLLRADR